jgi:putative nucleotidyltransferase with HDIG domain
VDVTVGDQRWVRRRGLAAAIRTVAFLAPVLLSLAVASLVARALPTPIGPVATAAWWAALLVGSGVALVLFDRLFRRLLPLSVLLNLALVFPGAAPSRFSAAIRSGSVHDLEVRIEKAKADAASADLATAAATVVELVGALAKHDPRTRGHCERTRAFSDLIAEELGLSQPDRDKLHWSALLHDIGKLHVEPTLLNKPSSLDEAEWQVLRSHPVEGARVVGALRTWLGEWSLAIEQHHERYDGGGYPRGLAGEAISLGGRIVAVADAFEVMTAVRAYKRPMSAATAREELVRSSGTHFDPHVVRAFLRVSIGRLPRAAAWLVPLAQLPGVVGVQRLVERFGAAALSAGAAAALVVGGVLVPGGGEDGGGGDVAAGPLRRPSSVVPAEPPAAVDVDATGSPPVDAAVAPAPSSSPTASPVRPPGGSASSLPSGPASPAPAPAPESPGPSPSPPPEPGPPPSPNPEPEQDPVSAGVSVRTDDPLPDASVGIRVGVGPSGVHLSS